MRDSTMVILDKTDIKKSREHTIFEDLDIYDFNILHGEAVEHAGLVVYVSDDHRYKILKSRYFASDQSLRNMTKEKAIEYCMQQRDYWNAQITEALKR
jgi:hypothetical protein